MQQNEGPAAPERGSRVRGPGPLTPVPTRVALTRIAPTLLALTGTLLTGTLLTGTAAAQQTCTLPVSPPPDQARVVFLLDTSGSMEGRGASAANIFAKVKGAVLRGMRASTAPGSVELLTFDQGPQKRYSFSWPAERAAFERTVNGLSAPGGNTWLYSSMGALFSSLPRQDRAATTVYVITDGLDNNPSRAATIDTALQIFDTVRGPLDKLYFVALGEQIPADIRGRFAATSFARALPIPVGQAPDFTSVALAPGLATVGSDGTFPYLHPQGSALTLASANIGGAAVSVLTPDAAGKRVALRITGTVPGGSVGYLCSRIGGQEQNVLLRFAAETPPPAAVAAAPINVLGTLLLLNPDADRRLKRGQSALLDYRAVRGPVTVEVASVPPGLSAALPDQTVSLLEGEQVTLKVSNQGLQDGQQAAPVLRLNDASPFPVPRLTGVVVKPFPWWWPLLGLLLLGLALWLWSRARRVFTPHAVSVDTRQGVYLHDAGGQRRRRWLRQERLDLGVAFREARLRGLVLEKFRPDIDPADEVLLDNSDLGSIREYSAQRTRRSVRLQAHPDTLRLGLTDVGGQPGAGAGTFLTLQARLEPGQLYPFADYVAPPVRVRPPMPPPEPPLEVIVSLLGGAGTPMQELELPEGDVDLADIFGDPRLQRVVVRREPGLLRLRALDPGMDLRHISREFRAGDALPLSVMLGLRLPGTQGEVQLRVRDKASMDRLRR